MNVLTDARLPFEFFIEGGRSRTGHLLPARLGLLSMLLDNQARQPQQRLALIPVWIDYDQIPDVTSYISQLNGQPKRKESLFSTLKSFRLLKRKLGTARITFAQPLLLESSQITAQPAAIRIGNDILQRINHCAQLSPAALLAITLLDQPQQNRQTLTANLTDLLSTARQLNKLTDSGHALTAADMIATALQHDQLTLSHDQVTLNTQQTASFWYLRNSSEHCMLLPALYLLFCQRLARPHALNINRLIRLIYPLLQAEYYLHTDPADLTLELKQMRRQLIQASLLQSAARQHWLCTTQPAVSILQRMAEGILIRYAILIGTLDRTPGLMRDELTQTCQNIGLQLQQKTGHPVALYADTRALEHLIDLLLQFEIIVEDQAQLRLNKLPRDLLTKMRQLLPEHVAALI